MDTNAQSRAMTEVVDRDAVDRNGHKIGKIFDVYTDEETGKPEWFAITSGLFGKKMSFVPVTGATFVNDDVQIPFDAEMVKDAPSVEADGELSQDEEARLYAHYGMGYSEARSGTGLPDSGPSTQQRPARTETGGGDDAMTRSEEELAIDKQPRTAGRARLHKWVETEHVNITVPVQREKAKLVTEPITDADRAKGISATDIAEADQEIVLSEEEIIVDKKVVPKERVRLETETVTEQRQVSENLAKERIEFEDETGTKSRPSGE